METIKISLIINVNKAANEEPIGNNQTVWIVEVFMKKYDGCCAFICDNPDTL